MLRPNNKRKGAIVPLAAVMTVFLLGMVAFGVDVGWMAVSQSELQNAADAAALAGAGPLMDSYVLYTQPANVANKTSILSTAKTNARNKAKLFAGYNGAGGVNSLSLLDADVEFGNTDASGTYTPSGALTGFPNTIKVTLRRDSTANGPLNLFFGRALGQNTTTLTATASATLYAGSLNMLPGNTLPMTYNQKYWKDFLLTGAGPDGTIMRDAYGNPQLQGYPSVKDTGNFGLLSMNDDHVGASTVRDWVNNGVPKSDLQQLVDRDLVPLNKHDQTKWDWNGENGFKASVVMDINDHAGSVFVLPLFKEYSATDAGQGNGSNYSYNIVEFVAIRIMPTSDTNRQVIVQPAAITAADTYFDSNTLLPISGNSTSPVTTFAAPKLTR